jgi:hypothetical protein
MATENIKGQAQMQRPCCWMQEHPPIST